MPKICYTPKSFGPDALDVIGKANVIIVEYLAQGFVLTLRQLYYQFVARGYLANKVKNYDRLGDIVSDARLAGLIDWTVIVDRTRNLQHNQHWTKPSEIIAGAMSTYRIDKWHNQENYVEVWVEKDALAGVLEGVCSELDVPLFPCRGYTSSSQTWAAGQRLIKQRGLGKAIHIIHLGDHDPSGIDMSRDIKARLDLFTCEPVHVLRIALNMAQVTRYNPPPNPAKVTDSRYEAYQWEYGDSSWELDALEPAVLVDLVRRAVNQYRDMDKWAEVLEEERKGRRTLEAILNDFPTVVSFLRQRKKAEQEPYA